MKIVKFNNGMYGIRKGMFFYKYLDLCCANGNKTTMPNARGLFMLSPFSDEKTIVWRQLNGKYANDCFNKDLKLVKQIFDEVNAKDYGTPLKNEDMVAEVL